MQLTLNAEMLLLTQEPETGTPRNRQQASAAVTAAVLVELCLRGRVRVERKRVTLTDPSATGFRLGDEVIAHLAGASRPRRLHSVMGKFRRGAVDLSRAELLARGVVSDQSTRAMGMFTVGRWPDADPAPRAHLRRQLDAAVLHHHGPDQRTAALVALINGARLHRLAFPYDLSGREFRDLKRRAAYLAEGSWADPALREMLQQSTAVVGAAMAASGGDGGDGGGGG